MEYIILNGENLSLDQFIQGVRGKKRVMLSEEAELKVIKARETIEKALKGKRVIYGLTTGFGALVTWLSQKIWRSNYKEIY